MRSTASSSIRPRDPLARFEQDTTSRFVDLRLVVGRKSTGEILFSSGGRWDRPTGRYLDQPATHCKQIWLNEAQCLGEPGRNIEDGPALAIKHWIDARKANSKRLIELVFDGGRGSGKSVLGTLAIFLIAIEFPDSRCWLVNPANTRRGEIQRIVRDFIPRQWRAWAEKDLTYTLPNGSTIQYIGADDEDALKQGGYEVALLNEAQLVTSQAYANVVAGVRNVSGRPKGLLILAHNYAAKVKGEWTNDHLDKIEDGSLNAAHHKLDPKLNGFLDEGVVDDIDASIRSVRPDLADIDALGIRRRLGDFACAAFKPFQLDKGGHVGSPPEVGWTEVTRQLTAEKTDTKNGFAIIFGADFQRRPGCVAEAFRLWRREDKRTVYALQKVIIAGDNEDDLARLMDDYLGSLGLSARDALVIADSTGRFQNASHSKNTKPSHDILREWFFTVVSPRRIKTSGKGFSKGDNPLVEDSLAQFYDICQDSRFLVAPSEEWAIESHRRCKIKPRGGTIRLDDSKPGHSHPVDCSRYVTWYFEPRRGPLAPPIDTQTADEIRKIRLLTSG